MAKRKKIAAAIRTWVKLHFTRLWATWSSLDLPGLNVKANLLSVDNYLTDLIKQVVISDNGAVIWFINGIYELLGLPDCIFDLIFERISQRVFVFRPVKILGLIFISFLFFIVISSLTSGFVSFSFIDFMKMKLNLS